MERLRLVPLDDTVVFPSMTVTLPVDVDNDDRVFLVPRHGGDYASVGRRRRGGGSDPPAGRPGRPSCCRGLHRGVRAPRATTRRATWWWRWGEARRDTATLPERRAPSASTAPWWLEILELRGDDGRVAAFLRSITEPGALARPSGYSPDLSFAPEGRALETLGVVERLELALRLQRERSGELQVRKRIRDDAQSVAQKQQRD